MYVKSTIIYDGVCTMCSRLVLFLRERDRKQLFDYVAYNSAEGSELLYRLNLQQDAGKYIIYNREGSSRGSSKHYIKSRAILEIARDLGLPYSLLWIFIVIPPFIRDSIYNLIARNRYKIL